jgi:MYXO-CTERM domain-containing protein
LLASVLVGAAWSYEVNGVTWEWQDHPFEDPVTVDVDTWPSSYSDTEVSDAIESALEVWTDVGLDLAFPFGGTASGLDTTNEGHWNVVYRSVSGSGWGGTLAYASTWTWSDFVGIDCDITFLSDNDYGSIPWSTDPSGAPWDEFDVMGVAIHEAGHCLGLGHSGTDEAIMYYAYQGLRELQDDDVDGVSSLYGATPCVDSDGDGFTDCADDCNDADPSVFPGAAETCDGADQGCDGVIDADATRTVAMGAASSSDTTDYVGIGNAFVAESDTLLLRARQRFLVDAGTRLVWSLRVLDGASWRLVRSERSLASGTGDEASPEMFVPLEAGETYALTLGAYVEGMGIYSDFLASTAAQGPIRPIGWLYGRAEGDDLVDPDDSFLIDQELDVVDVADPDGDGVTTLCGDPCPDDPKDLCDDTGAADGTGEDGTGDDGTGTDGTGDDGDDTADDSGATIDDTGSNGTDDGGGDDGTVSDDTGSGSSDGTLDDGGSGSKSNGGCSCGTSSSSPTWLMVLLAAALRRRRQSQSGNCSTEYWSST